MGQPSRFSHAVLQSHHAKELVDWYVDLLDGHVIFEGSGLAFMTYDDEHHRLGFKQLPGDAPAALPNVPGLVHLAYAYDSIAELADQYVRMRDHGVYPRLTVNHGLTLSLYYQDRDAHMVEMLVDLLDPAEASALMYSPYFARNPVGVLVHPEDLVQRIREGLTADVLVEEYRQTEVNVPTEMANVHAIEILSDEEFAAQFELGLAAK